VSIVALGGMLGRRPIVQAESVREALSQLLRAKSPELVEADLRALERGYAAAVTDETRLKMEATT
jgi:Pyruvate/2-oxoacid:ferredoxin oxidoreductase gamma subunit